MAGRAGARTPPCRDSPLTRLVRRLMAENYSKRKDRGFPDQRHGGVTASDYKAACNTSTNRSISFFVLFSVTVTTSAFTESS